LGNNFPSLGKSALAIRKRKKCMSRRIFLISIIIGLVLLLNACGGSSTELPAISPSYTPQLTGEIQPTQTISTQHPDILPTFTPRAYSPAQGGAMLVDNNDFFAASGNCAICHNQNYDESGNDVSFGELWRGSMMANSPIDQYYLAGVSMNVENFPEYRAAIESKCSSCHMPMAHTADMFSGNDSLIFGTDGYLDPDNPLHTLAVDGVSCTVCHQIQDEALGDFSSFSGGFVIDQDEPMGARILFGRFDLNHMSQNMMARMSGFVSFRGDHLVESEICATCHNLYTHYITEDGTFSEEWFAEQTPYSEWLHSDYATQSTCQDCHMPLAEGSVVLSSMGPGGPRSPFAQHSFSGGNVYMLDMLKNFGGEIGTSAGNEHFDSAIDRSMTLLENETANLLISDPELDGTTLVFDITTSILSGHKFPTGYPSRRAWLNVVVSDVDGNLIFESGSVGMDGAITGNANDQDPTIYEPHYEQINTEDQVQIYESIMVDVKDQLTTVLLAAASYVKDNRLLPNGFDKISASDDIKPYGRAMNDEDFTAGMDTVQYKIDTEGATGPFLIEVKLLFQSISYRWAKEISDYDTEPALTFTDYYNASPNLPVVIAQQREVSE
jgi:mono/diheme cytochrome c family protein